MKRRGFLKLLGGSVGSAALGYPGGALAEGSGSDLELTGPRNRVHPGTRERTGASSRFFQDGGFQRWTWVHGGNDGTPREWEERFRRLSEEGFSGVLVGGGNTEILAHAAHTNGLEFHRWIWTLNRNGDAWVREHHPEWFTVSRDGRSSLIHPPYVDYYRWLCPTRPQVKEYLRESILDIARKPEVDGIHLDYIRHCDVILPRGLWDNYGLVQDREYPEFDFCYCEACREEYHARSGVDPLDLPDPTADEGWRRFRWDSVTELVRVLAKAVHNVPRVKVPESNASSPGRTDPARHRRTLLRPASPGKPISAAVFPTPTIARRLVRQAWEEWPLDAFFPMLYHEFYEEGLDWIVQGVEEGLTALEGEDPPGDRGAKGRPEPGLPIRDRAVKKGAGRPALFAGLYLPTLNREGNREAAVEAARRAGADGVSFFEMNGI